MRLSQFSSVLGEISSFEDRHTNVPNHYLRRIMSLIDGCPENWQRLYDLAGEADYEFCPFHTAVPREEMDSDQAMDEDRSRVEIYIANVDELSGTEWFNCDPSVWLGIVAADLLGNGLFIYQFIRRAIDESDNDSDPELVTLLPAQVPGTYWRSSEALLAAELYRSQLQRQQQNRQHRAASGGRAKNKKYADAHQRFLRFYLDNKQLSRAEAARRFIRQLKTELAPGERPLYNREESAVRALRESLKKAGI